MTDDDLRASYDRVADEYVARIYHELDGKPLDRELLRRFARQVRGTGPVLDLGCGPGHVAKFLHDLDVEVTGIDLSPAMIERACALNPDLPFAVGDMRALAAAPGSIAGIVAMYSIVHLAPAALPAVFAELARVLRPGAPCLVAFHLGTDTVHLDEWWGLPVSVDFQFFDPAEVSAAMRGAGFRIVEHTERDPYPDVEHPSRRAYLLGELLA